MKEARRYDGRGYCPHQLVTPSEAPTHTLSGSDIDPRNCLSQLCTLQEGDIAPEYGFVYLTHWLDSLETVKDKRVGHRRDKF